MMANTFDYSYNIKRVADNKAFMQACKKIDDSDLYSTKDKLLVDVDGTEIQIYNAGKKKIKVVNDYEVDAVYIDSDINLNSLFQAS